MTKFLLSKIDKGCFLINSDLKLKYVYIYLFIDINIINVDSVNVLHESVSTMRVK